MSERGFLRQSTRRAVARAGPDAALDQELTLGLDYFVNDLLGR